MMVMLQPILISFKLNEPPAMVLLDTSSISKDAILLLDSFFRVIVHNGETVGINSVTIKMYLMIFSFFLAQWREQGLQNTPEHAHFKQLLEEPLKAAEDILTLRLFFFCS
jgi:protein transport protein SEC23